MNTTPKLGDRVQVTIPGQTGWFIGTVIVVTPVACKIVPEEDAVTNVFGGNYVLGAAHWKSCLLWMPKPLTGISTVWENVACDCDDCSDE